MRGAREVGFKGLIRTVSALLLLFGFCGETKAASSVQTAANASAGTASTSKGNVLAAFDSDTNSIPSSVADSKGNIFIKVWTQITSPGEARSCVHYVKNITGGADTSEYSSVDTVNPVDAQAGASGNAGLVSSGSVTTTTAGDVLYGRCVGDWVSTAGPGFTNRSTLNGNLIEDMTGGNPSSYATTGSATTGWTMQMVALRSGSSGSGTTGPPVIDGATTASGAVEIETSMSYRISGTNSPTSHGPTGLPAGLSVNASSGLISGMSTAAETSMVALTASNAGGIGNATLTLTATTPVAISTFSLPNGRTTIAYSATLAATGGTPPYMWNLISGTLPAGLSLSAASGTITGTPTQTVVNGALMFEVTDSSSPALTQTINLTLTVGTAKSQLMALSSNGKYLVNTYTGKPVFVVGDDAADLAVALSPTQVSQYLQTRASQGFNAIWVYSIDNSNQISPPKNFNGDVPFDGADFTNFNANYWANVDSILSAASSNGITVFLQPFFASNASEQPDQYYSSLLAASPATLQAYGAFLGNRYKGYDNIVWLLGGDAKPTDAGVYSQLNTLGMAIAAADPNHLMTFEACEQCVANGYNSVSGFQAAGLGVPAWLSLNWAYPQYTTTVAATQNVYRQTPFLPPLAGENFYELENFMTEPGLRFEMYTEILSGAYLGRIFGNGAIWGFNSPNGSTCVNGNGSCRSGNPTWQSQLTSAGSISQEYQGRLFRSREHWLLVRDVNHTVVTAGYGSGQTITTAARTSDGQTIIAYIPNGDATMITVAMNEITSASNTVQGWWYNPQTGAATLIGTFPNSGSQNFTAADGNDWVLVLDDASANLPAPGSADLSQDSSPKVTALSCAPTSVMSGSSSTCQVALNQAAPSGGASVNLASTNSSTLSVPASVMVASGTSKGTFGATAATVSAPQATTVTAALNGGSSSTTVLVEAPMMVSSLACSPSSVNSGGKSSCTITLNQPSSSGGTSVSLTNSNPASLVVPASLTVASGISTASFAASAAVVTASQSATLTATVDTSSQSTLLTILFVAVSPTPSITSLSPTLGAVGTAVTITGTNFGSSGTVTLNGTAATTTSWSATRIATKVPSGATTGNVVVTVGGVASNGVAFTVKGSTPSITNLNPTSGAVGKAVTITGTNFGSSGTVKFNGTTATTTSWNSTTIVTSVPTGATTGTVVVTVGAVASNGVSFTITSICGETGQSGTDGKNGDWGFGTPCVTGTDANGYTPASFEYWVGSPTSASFDLGIYGDSSGSPGSLLCHTGTTTLTPTAGWNNLSLAGKGCPTLNANTRYWLAYITSSNTIQQGLVGGTCPGTALASVYTDSRQGSSVLSNPFGTTAATPSCYSMYLILNNK